MPLESSPARRPPRSRLAIRFGAALCLGAAVILAVAAALNVSLQREHLTGALTQNASHSADLVRFALRDAMLRNDSARLRNLLDELGDEEGVGRIRIFDKDGRVLHSTREEELGQFVDTRAEQCVGCHENGWVLDTLAPDRRVRQFEDENGIGVLAVTTPVPNEPACSSAACHVHPADRKVLGVLDVQLLLAPVERHIAASQRQMAAMLGVTAVALVTLAAFLIWRLVLLPVRELETATRRVADGDLSTRAAVVRNDEIGALTESWNETVSELGRARANVDDLVATLEERVDQKSRELSDAHEQMLQVEKMASLGKLAAVVAHEVNNPLAGIATYARLLRRRQARRAGSETPDPAPGETARILELVESEAARCGEIVRNLLLFSRTPGRRFVETDLRTLLERCVMLVHHQADLNEVEIELEADAQLPLVTCDPSQIQQLVLALAMNALEAMPDGGCLRVHARPGDDEDVILAVEDSGQGISPDDLAHVFEPFYTTKSEGHGVGLGLAVVYGVARRHGGAVTVTSEPGSGTRFRVRLPLEPPPENGTSARMLEGVIS